MHALNAQHPQSLPARMSMPVWLAVFLSPTAYLLLLIIISRSQVPDPIGRLAVLLFGTVHQGHRAVWIATAGAIV